MGLDAYLYKITLKELDFAIDAYNCPVESWIDWQEANKESLLVYWRKEHCIDEKILAFKDLKQLSDYNSLFCFKRGFTAVHEEHHTWTKNIKFPKLTKPYVYLYYRSY